VAAGSPKMPWWRRWFGNRSERAAARYLRHAGMRVLARNVTTPHGEIDLIALEEGCVVFVEVRSTGGEDASRPAESVDREKQRRLTDAALDYLRRNQLLGCPARFDVLALSWPEGQREPTIEHFAHAFEAVGRGQMFS
jgi:putative endonuclease